jgi:hypothetical protein
MESIYQKALNYRKLSKWEFVSIYDQSIVKFSYAHILTKVSIKLVSP